MSVDASLSAFFYAQQDSTPTLRLQNESVRPAARCSSCRPPAPAALCTQSLSLSSTVARLWLSVRQCCSAAGGCRTPRLRCTWCQGWWQQRRWISLLSYGVVLCTKPETPKEFLAAMQFVKHSPVDALPDGTENNDAFFKIIKHLCFAPIPRKPAARDCRQRLRRPDSSLRSSSTRHSRRVAS